MRTIHIRLTPRASRNRIGDITEMLDGTEVLNIYVTEIPEHGKANNAMIDAVAAHFKVPKSKIELISGSKSRDKIIQIMD